MNRIQGMEASLRCFVLGLISLVPVLGVPASVVSIHHFVRARCAMRDEWNPAKPYLQAGLTLACIGLLGSLVSLCIALLLLIRKLQAGDLF